MKLAVTVLLLVVFAFMSADEAQAAKKPSWVKTSVAKWSVTKNPKQTDLNKPGYWIVNVSIKHTNNSKDQVITTFYDKSGTLTVNCEGASGIAEIKSTKVNRASVDPGSSYTLSYSFPITKFSGNYEPGTINSRIRDNNPKGLKLNWSYDVAIKSEGI